MLAAGQSGKVAMKHKKKPPPGIVLKGVQTIVHIRQLKRDRPLSTFIRHTLVLLRIIPFLLPADRGPNERRSGPFDMRMGLQPGFRFLRGLRPGKFPGGNFVIHAC